MDISGPAVPTAPAASSGLDLLGGGLDGLVCLVSFVALGIHSYDIV